MWHDEVSLHSVKDVRTGQTLGYFFMDLHPRDGKYGHAAMWNLQSGSLDRHGGRMKAVAAMVCNFPRSTATKPALMYHRQVQTLFHEFGHVMHGLVSRTNISTFYGTSVESDFVEAPSQMLENWVWQKESLKLMSGHYKDNSSIPDDLLKKLVKSKSANEGGKSLRQMFFGTFDLAIHTRAEADTIDMSNHIYQDLLGIERINGTNIGANLGHLGETRLDSERLGLMKIFLVGYDAGYYGYMWSLVFAQDMFDSRFGVEGVLNPDTGMDYRNMILGPGHNLAPSCSVFYKAMFRRICGCDGNVDKLLGKRTQPKGLPQEQGLGGSLTELDKVQKLFMFLFEIYLSISVICII